MILRAILVIASGFIFIFSPGLPMSLINRYSPDYKRDLVYWGIGAWLIANLINQFLSILMRMIMYSGSDFAGFTGQPKDFIFIILSAFISAICIGFAMYLVLRIKNKKDPGEDILANGLALGFGAGLVAQVFTGITLVGAGFQVLFGNTISNITVEAIADSSLTMLVVSILTLILFRVALLAISAVQGVLTAKSIQTKKGQFWSGVLVATVFTSLILIIQLLMGESMPGQISVGITPTPISIVSGVYYLLAFLAGYRWLIKNLQIKQIKKK